MERTSAGQTEALARIDRLETPSQGTPRRVLVVWVGQELPVFAHHTVGHALEGLLILIPSPPLAPEWVIGTFVNGTRRGRTGIVGERHVEQALITHRIAVHEAKPARALCVTAEVSTP